SAPPPSLYVPPPPPDDEASLFRHAEPGINFDNHFNIPVEVSGHDPPNPIADFHELSLGTLFERNVTKAGYTKPTPVQRHGIPIVMAGRDLMACAQTGSGKTAAFLLPVLTQLVDRGVAPNLDPRVQRPAALCVAPTRELITQIYLQALKFSHGTVVRCAVVYGGTSVVHQLQQLERGCHLLCGTPGRLLDVINRGRVCLSKVEFVVLDEADRMLELGFEQDVRSILQSAPSREQRQTLMFSATFPTEIQKLAGDFLRVDYLFVVVGRVGAACCDVQQAVERVGNFEKRDRLLQLLGDFGSERTLVFVETKRSADFLACLLCQSGFPTTSIHGDRQQREREEALGDFKTGRVSILVATSVAARGLDIDDVRHVVNYDLPSCVDDYVHRIGRTGRIGHRGAAVALYDPSRDRDLARPLVRVLSDAGQDVPPWLEEEARGAVGTSFGGVGGTFSSRDVRRQARDTHSDTHTVTHTHASGGGDEEEPWD
ncbi:unnamed protein product, partial [Lampetra fluviatilis]